MGEVSAMTGGILRHVPVFGGRTFGEEELLIMVG